MKRAAFMMLLAICTVAVNSQSVDAGSGKRTKAEIQVRNTNAASGRAITIFIVPNGTATPTTKAQAMALTRKNVAGGKTEVFNVRSGVYTVVAGDTAAFGMLGTHSPIPPGSFTARTVILHDNNSVLFSTSTPVGATLPVRPQI